MLKRYERKIDLQHATTLVRVGSGVLGESGSLIHSLGEFTSALVVTDENLSARYGGAVRDSIAATGLPADLHAVPPGDASKSLAEAERIYDKLGEFGLARDGMVVAVGGGMITDLAGFAAATWMRGVPTVYCPTTLEADIDACVGGKTGVNHPLGKNLIGAFHHPRAVLVDVACLATLPDRDLVAGLAESIKHAAITGEAFLAWHETNSSSILTGDEETLAELIDRNIAIKADIVVGDERETTGVRSMLNFGHTIGHAIESISSYRLRHGECVSLGMTAVCRLSHALGMLSSADSERIIKLLDVFGLPTHLTESIDVDAIWDRLARDKKVARGEVRFVLLEGIGRPTLKAGVPESAVRAAIASL